MRKSALIVVLTLPPVVVTVITGCDAKPDGLLTLDHRHRGLRVLHVDYLLEGVAVLPAAAGLLLVFLDLWRLYLYACVVWSDSRITVSCVLIAAALCSVFSFHINKYDSSEE